MKRALTGTTLNERCTGLLRIILSCSILFQVESACSQNNIENVIVETYYIASANDAIDTLGGGLAVNSTTYRVYIDLCDSCALISMYGDTAHPLSFSSTAPFYNHLDRGKVFGHQINTSWLDEGLVALDSWLSLGGGTNALHGIPKDDDPDGAVPLEDNDGGSPVAPGPLLANNDPTAGLPVLERDGLTSIPNTPTLPPNFNVFGDDLEAAFKDSTLRSDFISDSIRIACSAPGVRGVQPWNRILVAQLTTSGDLAFSINIEVLDPNGQIIRYVATGDTLLPGETVNGLLTYPPDCGCTDPTFLEYDPTAGCDDGSCATTIIFGCSDSTACNFDGSANFNVPELCCYGPDDCNGLDVDIVCPSIGIATTDPVALPIKLYPNPARTELNLAITQDNSRVNFMIRDALGRMVGTGSAVASSGEPIVINIADLVPGVHWLHVITSSGSTVLPFVRVE